MSLRALLDRDDIPEDAKAIIRDVLTTPPGDAVGEQALWRQRELAHDLVGADSLGAALELSLQTALDLTGFEAGGIYLVEEGTGDLVLACHRGLSAAFVAAVGRAPGDSPRAQRVRSGRSLYWSPANAGAIPGEQERQEGLRAIAGVPVLQNGHAAAWLNVASRTSERLPPGGLGLLASVAGLLGVALHRLQIGQALRESEGRYLALVESASDAIFAVDADGTILAVNPSAARMLGRSPEEAVGRSLRDVFALDDAEHRIDMVRRVHETGAGLAETYEAVYPGVGRRWVSTTLSPVLGPDEEVMCVLGIARDITEHLEHERALRASEELYRTLVEAAPDAIMALDRDGRILSANAAMAERLGCAPESPVGLGLRDFVPEESAQRRMAWVHEVLSTGIPVLARDRGTVPGYEGIWYEAIHAPVRDAEGSVQSVLVISRDVTEQANAEEALRRTDQRYAMATAAGKVAVWDWDARTGELYDSPALPQMLGYGVGGVPYDWREWERLRHPDDRARVAEAVAALTGGEAAEFVLEQRLRHADGDYRWILTRGNVLRDEEGHVVRMVGTNMDITEPRRSEEALRRSEERYALATAAGKVAVWDHDPTAPSAQDFEQLRQLLGYGPDDPLQLPADWDRVCHPDDRGAAHAATRGLREGTAGEFVLEQRLLHRDGTYHWVLTRGKALRDEQDRVVRMIGTNTDITDQKQAEEERRRMAARLVQAERLQSLGVLAGGVAHDLSNLLTGLLGNLSLARRRLARGSPARAYLERAESAVSQAAELAESMLAYSGRGLIEFTLLSPPRLLSEAIDLAATGLPGDIELVADIPADLPTVRGEAAQLRAVIVNLIRNAAEAIGEAEGVVSVGGAVVEADRARLGQTYVDDNLPEGRYVCISVVDTGPGMDDDTRTHIFDPFFSTKPSGRGLGLASALGVVRAHRGAIQVRSRPGRGSALEVLLPVAEGSVEAPPAAEPAAGDEERPCSGTLLLAEDEALVRAVAAAALEEAGFTVLAAADGSEALRLFLEQAADIRAVLLDLAMPRTDGVKVLREIRRLRPGIPVIVASAYEGDNVVARLEGSGPARSIRKPYRPEQLVAGVRELLRP